MRTRGTYVARLTLAAALAAAPVAPRAAAAQTAPCRAPDGKIELSTMSAAPYDLQTAATAPLPTAALLIGDQLVDLAGGTCFDGTRYHLGFAGNVGSSAITLTAEMDPDPYINFAFGVTNFAGVAQSYSLLLQIPIVAGLYDHARGVLSTSITDNVGMLDGASLGAFGALPLLRGSASNGGPFASLDVDRGVMPGNGPVPCVVAAGVGAGACAYGVANGVFAPTAYNLLRAQIDFTLSPDQDNVGLVGGVSILATTTPEPSAVVLLAAGLASLGAAARARRGESRRGESRRARLRS